MTKIVILYSSAGYGLEKDANILRASFVRANYDVELKSVSQTDIVADSYLEDLIVKVLFRFNVIYFWKKILGLIVKKSATIYLHLENIHYKELYRNARHVLIPNQEWFRISGISLLPCISQVWCKTHLAHSIFSELGVSAHYVGFSSGDIESNKCSVPLKNEFFSRIGRSAYRGADILVSIWMLHPEWPTLNLVIDPSRRPVSCPPNVNYVNEFETVEDYHAYANQFAFHIYATETEGFGHSIYEGMRAGALILLTDAPPMNEIAGADNVILIPSVYCGHKGLSPRFAITRDGLENSVNKVLGLSESARTNISLSAKNLVKKMDEDFQKKLHETLQHLVQE